jgi:hypothetical protein
MTTDSNSLVPPELILRAEGGDELQRLVAVLSLGMCRAITLGVASPSFAGHRLFGPALMKRLANIGANAELIRAIHLASELENVQDIVPEHLADSVAEVESLLTDVLRQLIKEPVQGDEKWLQKERTG